MLKYVLLSSLLLLSACSGSLTDSGIFWCKEKALAEQELKRQELYESQERFAKTQQQYKELNSEQNNILSEIAKIENKIAILNEEIAQEQQSQGGNQEKYLQLQQVRQQELNKLHKIKENEKRRNTVPQTKELSDEDMLKL